MHLLRYGDHEVEVELPDDRVDPIVAGTKDEPDESRTVRKAIDASRPGLVEFLGESDSVLVVISDHTRNTGSRTYMPILLERIRKPGRTVTILVALGLHRPSTEREIAQILGCDTGNDVIVLNHDPDGNLAPCGESMFCREAVIAGKVIITGSVAFHPMAGYSGGRKSLLPGIASRESILENHRLYFSGDAMHPGIGPASVLDNPIQSDIRNRTKGFDGRTWCLNVVQDEMKSIVFAAAGTVDDAWAACCGYLERTNAPELPGIYPVVVASAGGFPSDFSFYQSMKTLTNASRACVKGGSIFLLMECRNGWELDADILSWGHLDLARIARRIREDFTMSGLAMYMALSVIRAHRVFCLSSLPAREVAGLGMRHLASEKDIGGLVASELPDASSPANGRTNRARTGTANRIALIPAAAAILPSSAGGRPAKEVTHGP